MLKLSEAIRLGAMLGQQLRGKTRDGDGGSCALGAALLAIGRTGGYTEAFDVFPLSMVERPFPTIGSEYDGKTFCVLSICRILNDDRRWTREQIADWVETLEAQQREHDPMAASPVTEQV